MLKQELVNEARTWINTPYKHQGRIKGKSCDCGGLVIGVMSNVLGYDSDTIYGKRYARNFENWKLKEYMDNHDLFIPKQAKDMEIGDVLLCSISIHPSHVGILSDYDERNFGIIHCYTTIGRVVEHRFNSMWLSKVVRIYEINTK